MEFKDGKPMRSYIDWIYNNDFSYQLEDYRGITSIEEEENGAFKIYLNGRLWRKVYSQEVTVCYKWEEEPPTRKYITAIKPEDHVFLIQDFKEQCKNGSLTNYDGSGFYSDGITYDWDYPVDCSYFTHDKENKNFTHVVWFNR